MNMEIIYLFLFCTVVGTIPINVNKTKETGNADNELTSRDRKALQNDLNEAPRAGIIDNLNPFNKNQQSENKANTDTTQGGNNPLQAVQNLFSNAPQFLNGSNPFQQLFSSQPGGNFLDNIKVFFVGTQGMVMPASAILGGFQNLMGALGNMGNFQLPQLPSLPSLPSAA